MKPTKRHTSALKSVAIIATLLCAVASSPAQTTGSTIPSVPAGWLSAFPTVVKTGTRPLLTWDIGYPSVVMDFITITAPSTLSAKELLNVEVRVIGNGVTAFNSRGQIVTSVDAEALISYKGAAYERIFYGNHGRISPSTIVWARDDVQAGETLRFGGRYFYGTWSPAYYSNGTTQNIRAYTTGQFPGTSSPLHLSSNLKDFLRPYLDGSGKIKIGPMDVLVMMELTHTDSQYTNQGYDLQDLVLLVTFRSKRGNNGHGNNIDGIDSSNKGKAPWINEDTDPTVDDEK